MEKINTLTVNYKDSVTHNPIPIVQVIDSNGLNQTTSTGTFVAQYNYSVVVLYATSSGYLSKSTSYVMDEDKTATVYLVATLAPNNTAQQNTWYTPKQIGITVSRYDPAGVHVPGATLVLNANGTTLPSGWLNDLYGVKPDVANQMLNGTLIMSGTTGGDGVAAFTVLSSIGYDVTVTDPKDGSTWKSYLYPSDYTYTVWIGTSPLAVNVTKEQPLNSTKLYVTQPDIGNVTLNLLYQDHSGSTTDLHFVVKTANNMTTIWDQDLGNPGTAVVYANKTYPNIRGNGVFWFYNATRNV
jgi:hypothetical protein